MSVFKFYSEQGWYKRKKNTNDAILFEDLRPVASEYVSYCRKKINNFLPKKVIIFWTLLQDQFNTKSIYNIQEILKRHCVDFSKQAINSKKNWQKGKFYCNDFLKIKFKDNYFDAIISLHTLYHISKNKQKRLLENL